MKSRILVVEDNPANLELVLAFLEGEGCQALIAENAELGLRLACSEHPDLIFMDLQLPGVTGLEATRRLKAEPATAGIPVVALTAFAMRGDEAKARAAGCDEYLTKPLDLSALRMALRRLLLWDSAGSGSRSWQTETGPPEGARGKHEEGCHG